MKIRKLFKFEGAHIVRNCFTERCRTSVHGHSYKVEVVLESRILDKSHMVIDFGLLKHAIPIGEIVDSFDHAWSFWEGEDHAFQKFIRGNNERWISMPFIPSAEAYALVIFLLVDVLLKIHEENVWVNSVRVHETDTGWAEADLVDINPSACEFRKSIVENLIFSSYIKRDWSVDWMQQIKNSVL